MGSPMSMTELERARELGRAALQTLEANRRRIDDLNVYPVPDGYTGTNLTEDCTRDHGRARGVDGIRPCRARKGAPRGRR